MADVKLVIKIPEEDYDWIKRTSEGNTCYPCTLRVYKAIENGTPLPKGHDIIDGTELNKYLDDLIYAEQKVRLDGHETRTDIIERIKIKADFLTIIEADKESNDTHDKTCMNCFHNYGVQHNTEFNSEDIVCEYWESDGLTKDDFCSRWKDKEEETNNAE